MNPNYQEFKFPQIRAYPWGSIFKPSTPPDSIDLIGKLLAYVPEKRLKAIEVTIIDECLVYVCIWCCLNEWRVVVFRIFESIYLWGWWNLNHKLTRCDVYLISLTHSQIHTFTVNVYFFSRLMYHHIYSFPHVGMLSPILSWATSTQHYYAGRIPSSTWAVRIHSWRDGSGTSHAGTTHSRVPEEYQTTSLHSIEHRVIKHNNNWWDWWWRRWRRWLPSRI